MLCLLAPREYQHDKVADSEILDEAKVVTIGGKGLSKGKANLLKLFDNSPLDAADFVKSISINFDFHFFDKSGKRLCLTDRALQRSLQKMLSLHQLKIKRAKDLYFHVMRPKKADEPLGDKEFHKLSQGSLKGVKSFVK
jgi:hypothetical protein